MVFLNEKSVFPKDTRVKSSFFTHIKNEDATPLFFFIPDDDRKLFLKTVGDMGERFEICISEPDKIERDLLIYLIWQSGVTFNKKSVINLV